MAEVIIGTQAYPLKATGTTLFGRTPRGTEGVQPDVPLDAETPGISRTQCHVVAVDGAYRLFDGWPNGQASTNGTLLDSRKVSSDAAGEGAVLTDNSTIQAPANSKSGKRVDIYVRLPEGSAVGDDDTEFIDNDAAGLDDATVFNDPGMADGDDATATPRPKAFLRVAQGLDRKHVGNTQWAKGVNPKHVAYKGKAFDLTTARSVEIGRGATCRVVLEDPDPELARQISRRHAEIQFNEADGQFMLLCRSPNGIRVNGKTIYDQVGLDERASIEIGSTILRWTIERPGRRAPWYVRHEGLSRGLLIAAAVIAVVAASVYGYHRVTNQVPEMLLNHTVWSQPAPNGHDESIATGAVADLNNDGIPDVVAASAQGGIWSLDGRRGGQLWNRPLDEIAMEGGGTRRLGAIIGPLAVEDLQGDGIPDVIAGAGSRVVVAAGDSGRLTWYQDVEGQVLGGPAVADLDGNGFGDIIVPVIDGNETGVVTALRGDSGGTLWRTAPEDGITSTVPPAVADVSGDGVMDVVLSNRLKGAVHALDGRTGSLLWTAQIRGASYPFPPIGAPAVGDLTGDGVPDAVVLTPDYMVVLVDGRTGTEVRRANLQGSMFVPQVVSNRYFTTAPVLADVTGDGWLDVITAHMGAVEGVGNFVYAIDGREFRVVWTHVTGRNIAFAPPALADLDRDGAPEVVLVTAECGRDDLKAIPSTSVVEVLDGKTGNTIHQVVLSAADTAQRPTIQASPLLADLDGDRRLDIVVQQTDATVQAIGLNVPTERSAVAWGAQRGGPANSARYAKVVRTTERLLLSISLGALLFALLLLAVSGGFVVWARRWRQRNDPFAALD
jgi:outer membrane protein assembly factor BamB